METKNVEKVSKGKKFMDGFTRVAVKIGNQIHLRSLRDAFAVLMPLFILAGIGVLINNVVFPLFAKGQTLLNLQIWGNLITNGTLNIAGLVLAPVIGYCLARNRNYENRLVVAVVALACLVIMMPINVSLIPNGAKNAIDVSGVLAYTNLGTTGMFSGIIIGLVASEAFMKLSKIKKLQIHLGDNIPPAVAGSFNSMIPVILTISFFAIISAVLSVAFNTNLIKLITDIIQEPLRKVNTSLPGMLLIYSTGNLLFTFGIHQTVINGTLLDPLLLINTNQNMAAFAAGKAIPHIINGVFRDTFGMIGGTGSTICLLIATLIFSKMKASRDVTSLSIAPGLFNINEPVIFGYPIVFNIPMMIPFVLTPVIGILIAYFFTAIGFMNRVVVMVPWTTPPLINAYLATGGDWRAILVQLLIIVVGILFYLPFMKVSERVIEKQAEMAKQI